MTITDSNSAQTVRSFRSSAPARNLLTPSTPLRSILGAPGLYVPLSIQLPSHARDMRMYQAMTAEKQLWWSADRLSTLHHHAHPVLEARTGNPDASQDTARDLLQLEQDLSNAIASHIPQPPPTLLRAPAANDRVAPTTKTSESHPIK